jgi:pilus assembly protein FimV
MAFNKSKALENALKYLNQGKVNQAIAEYQMILRSDPKDQATLMTVGDLFARQGDMQHALEYFERLAQVYLADGFNSKAIAIYKKIAKLAPSEIAPLERLADLYVQQGVLSEARPLFLQIAEAHIKANRPPKAVEVLRRLLEVEPENPRVQMRLAELYNALGQKGDAAKTYLGYAQRLFDRGEAVEADKLAERALEVLPCDPPALLLKAKIFASAGKDGSAIKLLGKHPEADAGGEVTNLLVDLELKTGQLEAAADRARNQLVRGNSHFGLLFRVTKALVDSGHTEEALPLFHELRDPMIEVGEHDKFVKSLSAATERLPGNTEALELLADFCRHTSDPFPLTVALAKLADIHEAAGNDARAEVLLEELIDRNRDDERLAFRLDGLRARMGKSPQPPAEQPQQKTAQEPLQARAIILEEEPPLIPSVRSAEETLDPETQRYVAQALTDVDLFSSYGLAQKAANLLESVLQRAPHHTPALERLLDLSLGAANDQRTAQLAATLEQLHRDRGDGVNAERFAELRKRYQSAAGLSDEQLARSSKENISQQPRADVEPSSVGAVPVDILFETPQKLEKAASRVSPPAPSQVSLPREFIIAHPAEAEVHGEPQGSASEVDLSDEWEAMVQEVIEPPPAKLPEIPIAAILSQAQQSHTKQPAPGLQDALDIELSTDSDEPLVYEIRDESAEPVAPLEFPDVPLPDPSDAGTIASVPEFELELTPAFSEAATGGPATTEEFITGLAAEVDGMEPPSADDDVTTHKNIWAEPEAAPAEGSEGAVSPATAAVAEPSAESLNHLAEVFQEFRSELGELNDEQDEDLETHYNLGIAYREMGLLEEAIGEFQKVAHAVQKGKPFRYTMNCAALLALAFRDKGEPKIASLWYKRALEVPGLEQDTILALRYDLGISLEMSEESDAALDCFRQVYAMNIDYRDVADRIATLQHH